MPDDPKHAALLDPARVAAVRATGLLDAPPSEVLDRLARAATGLLGVPVALVSLVDADRQWFAGLAGLTGWAAEGRQTPLSHSFCQHVVAAGDVLVVADAETDPRVRGNLALPDLGVRAYAGVPLATRDGLVLGAMCAIDTVPRRWTPAQLDGLRDLAAAAVAELSLRTALRQADERAQTLRAALELSPEISWVADADGAVVDLSPRWLEATGMSTEASLGAGWASAVHPDDREAAYAAWCAALATRAPYDVEHRLRHADGRYRWMRSRARPQLDAEGRVVRWFGFSEDVHERREARAALADGDARYRSLLRHYPAGAVFLVDHRLRFLVADGVALRHAGFDPASMVGRTLGEVLPAPSVAHLEPHYRAALAGEERSFVLRVAERVYECRAVPVRDAEGQVVAGMVLSHDVTERHRAEERLALALDATEDGVWDWDVPTGHVHFSPRWCTMLGHASGEIAPHVESLEVAVHPDDLPAVRAALAAHLRGETARYASEHRKRHRDGHWVWVLDRGKVVARDAAGAPTRVVGAQTDVTARRSADAALRRESLLRQTLFEASADCVKLLDLDGRMQAINAAGVRLLELDDGAAIAGQPWADAWPAPEAALARAALRRALAGGTGRFQAPRTTVKGTPRWWDVTATLVRDELGAPSSVLVVSRDMTEAHATERQLRESEERLAGIIGSAMDAILTTDAAQRVVLANAAAEHVFGYAAGRMVGLPLDALLPPSARAAHRDHMERFGRDGTTTRAMGGTGASRRRLTALHRDGTEFPIEASISQVETTEGRFFTVILRDVTERERAEAERDRAEHALRASEERYALAARAASNAIWDWDLASGGVTWSEGLVRTFGHAPGTSADATWWTARIHPEDRERVVAGLHALLDAGGEAWEDGYRFLRGDGTWADVVDRGYVMRDGSGHAVRMAGAMEDVTALRASEARLRQAQKMEAVGQLAGGVAHDFNNLLTVIAASLEFVREDLEPGHRVRPDLDEIAHAAERARALVRQLLLFSRRERVHPHVLDLAAVVRDAERLLRRVIGEEIALATALEGEAFVRADAGQLEQLLMNLAVNARDAMRTPLHGSPGTGGTLEIAVEVVEHGPAEARPDDGAAPGRWVRLQVRDTGHGMDDETRSHIFEPFFTTKAVGAGTGLGLATAFGIVRQADGTIQVDSAPGRGTTFTILFPAAERAAADGDGAHAGGAARPRRGGTILLIEDETPVRIMARRILERRGYAVLEARHGGDALVLWGQRRAEIAAVVSDVRMPEMDGPTVVAHLKREAPELPVVFLSGYTDEGAALATGPGQAFVEKPFTADVLLQALDDLLAVRGAD